MWRQQKFSGLAKSLAVLLCAGCLAACDRSASPTAADGPPRSESTPPETAGAVLKVKKRQQGLAAWYEVPQDSLARRRAGEQELTAAHNELPIGTLVRVTHLENGKQVLVRITDRGIRAKKVKIDLCREAAEELDMISQGLAQVRVEVLEENRSSTTLAQAGNAGSSDSRDQ
jgi:rare lipoprotein A